MYDTIIIGAGMSGLAAGIRLAHYDRRVCILERHSAVGGLNSFFGRGGRTYDVGLHAVTNYAPRGTRQGPLARLLRQLRLAWDEFSLSPQVGSAIMFPGVTLEFSNDLEVLESEIARNFPAQADNFRRFVAALTDYDQFDRPEAGQSARAVVGSLVTDPLLVEMLLCPVLFYGGSREHDMDFGQFSILFRSIFLEGLARPLAGIRLILKRLLRKFCDLGGELRLRLRSGADPRQGRPGRSHRPGRRQRTGIQEYPLLGRPAGDHAAVRPGGPAPRPADGLSIVESISVLNRQPRALGHCRTMIFFNDSDKFHYEKPADAADLRSGVVCSPNNFVYGEPLADGILRITRAGQLRPLDRAGRVGLPPAETPLVRPHGGVGRAFHPDFRDCVVETEVITPVTIRRFTGHEKGAISAPEKATTAPRT